MPLHYRQISNGLVVWPPLAADPLAAYDEPTEQVAEYAPYRLTVNGVLQPDG